MALITTATTLVPVGACFGALSGGFSEKLGRRKYLIIIDIVAIVGSVINCIPSTPTFMIGRFIGGITAGVSAAVAPLYNTEFTPNKMRGALGAVFQINLGFGILIAYIISLPILWLPDYWLILVFAFPILPASIQMLMFWSKFKYEPYPWLMKKDRLDEGKKSVECVYFAEFSEQKYNKFVAKSKEHEEIGANIG